MTHVLPFRILSARYYDNILETDEHDKTTTAEQHGDGRNKSSPGWAPSAQ